MIINGHGGEADVWAIWKNMQTGTYHPVFLEESPMPGPVEPISELPFIRLKSRMHHTTGFATLAEAVKNLEEGLDQIKVDDNNVVKEAIEWDGQLAHVYGLPNWTREKRALKAEELGRKVD